MVSGLTHFWLTKGLVAFLENMYGGTMRFAEENSFEEI